MYSPLAEFVGAIGGGSGLYTDENGFLVCKVIK